MTESREEIRKRENRELIRRMRCGEQLWSFDSQASFYPPRPLTKKDPELVKKLFGTQANGNK